MPHAHRPLFVLAVGFALIAGACARHGGDQVVLDPIPRVPAPDPQVEPETESDASLTDLILSAAPLEPKFDPDTFTYTAAAPFSAFDTTLTPTASDVGATIEIRGEIVPSGDASSPIPLLLGETIISVHVTSADGGTQRTYVVTVTRSAPELDLAPLYAKATNTDSSDRFGTAIALDGDTLVVGAPFEDSAAVGPGGSQADNSAHDAGAVFVYSRSGGAVAGWTLEAYLKAHNAGAGDRFGSALALDGDRLIVGAPGEDSSAAGALGNGQGVGFDNICGEAGAAYVFERTNGQWTQTAYLKGPSPRIGDAFGSAVALAGVRAAVGMPGEDSDGAGVGADPSSTGAHESGAVSTFRLGPAGWDADAFFKAPASEAGDGFGSAVCLRGATLIVGTPGDDGALNQISDAGAVHMFLDGNGAWVPGQTLRSPDPDIDDHFGAAIDAKAALLAVGAPGEDSGAQDVGGDTADNSALDAGAVFVFRDAPQVWTLEAYVKAPNTDPGDRFGSAVAIDQEVLLVGAPFERSSAAGINGSATDNSLYGAGAAYLYGRVDGTWQTAAYGKSLSPDPEDLFGNAVAIDGVTLAAAARKEDGAGTGFGGDPSDNLAADAGCVFVITAR